MPKETKSLGNTPEKDTNEVKEEDCPESILESILKTRIFDSKVVFEHEFDHCRDEEEDIGMEESHTVIAVISAEFDGTGECNIFDILAIRPCDTEDFVKKSM